MWIVSATIALAVAVSLVSPLQASDGVAARVVDQVIRRHRLLSPAEYRCSLFTLDSVTRQTIEATVREKHDAQCGGDPEVSPRRFSLAIDRRSGAARWDKPQFDNGRLNMDMRPVPPASRSAGRPG
jgi:hypothetical protein